MSVAPPRHDSLATGLSDEATVLKHIARRLNSHEWWLFIVAREGAPTIVEIEREFYDGKGHSGDFEAVFVPGGARLFYAVFLAKKEHLSRDQMLKAVPGLPSAEVTPGKADVVILGVDAVPAAHHLCDRLKANGHHIEPPR